MTPKVTITLFLLTPNPKFSPGNEEGLAWQGLLVRHLVLPGGLAGTNGLMEFLAEEISPDTYLNIMDQYYPSFRAREYPPLDRRLTDHEYREAVAMAREAGLQRMEMNIFLSWSIYSTRSDVEKAERWIFYVPDSFHPKL